MEQKRIKAKQRINNNICRCQGIYMNLDDQLERYFDLLTLVLHEMNIFGVEDFKIGNHALGVRKEIESVLQLLNSYNDDFQRLLEKYENIEEGNK